MDVALFRKADGEDPPHPPKRKNWVSFSTSCNGNLANQNQEILRFSEGVGGLILLILMTDYIMITGK